MDYKIVGLVGPLACGKGVVADYLIKKYHYISFSLSSIVHEEVKKRGIIRYNRTLLQNIGNELREKEGDGVLARRALNMLYTSHSIANGKIIIEGIRNPGEVDYLRTFPGFFLIAVHASQKIRFQRVLTRGKPWDPKDWKTFLQVDERDRGEERKISGQQVQKCVQLADIQLQNNKSIAEFYAVIEKTIGSLFRVSET